MRQEYAYTAVAAPAATFALQAPASICNRGCPTHACPMFGVRMKSWWALHRWCRGWPKATHICTDPFILTCSQACIRTHVYTYVHTNQRAHKGSCKRPSAQTYERQSDWCFYLSLSVPICPYLSLSVPICPYLSLSVPICPYLSVSISVSISLYQSLCIAFCCCLSLSVAVCRSLSQSVPVCQLCKLAAYAL
jgi:hypothetical protein